MVEPAGSNPNRKRNQSNFCEVTLFPRGKIADAEVIAKWLETIKQQLDWIFKTKFSTQALPNGIIIATTLVCIGNIQESIYSIEDSLENTKFNLRNSIVHTLLNDQPPGIKGVLHEMAANLRRLDNGAKKEDADTVEAINKYFRELPKIFDRLIQEVYPQSQLSPQIPADTNEIMLNVVEIRDLVRDKLKPSHKKEIDKIFTQMLKLSPQSKQENLGQVAVTLRKIYAQDARNKIKAEYSDVYLILIKADLWFTVLLNQPDIPVDNKLHCILPFIYFIVVNPKIFKLISKPDYMIVKAIWDSWN